MAKVDFPQTWHLTDLKGGGTIKLLATSSRVKIVKTNPMGTIIKPKNKLQPGTRANKIAIPPPKRDKDKIVIKNDFESKMAVRESSGIARIIITGGQEFVKRRVEERVGKE